MKYDHEIDMTTDNSVSMVLRRVTPNSKVLEFGSATGYMTRYMKEELGCTIFCVEIDRKAAEIARKYCDKMIIEDLETMQWVKELQLETFDHIIFADVIEHLRNPLEVLKNSISFLKQEGTLITSIPNIGHNSILMELLQGRFDYRSLGLLDDTHVKFFTKKSILQLLEQANLYPVEWLGTIASPESTEFQQKYAYFPDSVRRVLANREDGHVYQYVTVSKKKPFVHSIEIDNKFKIEQPPIHCDYLEIYWKNEAKGYTPANCVAIPIKLIDETYQYHVKLPIQHVPKSIRIDLGNRFSLVEMESIHLTAFIQRNEGIEEIILCVYSKENNYDGLIYNTDIICLNSTLNNCFLVVQSDPQLHLENIPHDLRNASVELKIKLRISEDPSEIISRVRDHLFFTKEILNNISKLETQLQERNELTTVYSQEISSLKSQLKDREKLIESISRVVSTMEYQLNEKDQLIEMHSGNALEIESQLREKENLVQRQSDALLSLNTELNHLQENLVKLQVDFDENYIVTTKQAEELSVLHHDIQQKTKEIYEIRSDLLQKEDELDKKQRRILELENNEATLLKQNNARNLELVEHRDVNKHLQSELANEKMKLQQLENSRSWRQIRKILKK